MNNKAEAKFAIITTIALIIIGVGFVMLIKTPITTGYSVYESKCYQIIDNEIVDLNFEACCSEIKQSTSCKEYQTGMFKCSGETKVFASKETIARCQNV